MVLPSFPLCDLKYLSKPTTTLFKTFKISKPYSNPSPHFFKPINPSYNQSKQYLKPSHTLSAGRSLLHTPCVHNPISFSGTKIVKPVIWGSIFYMRNGYFDQNESVVLAMLFCFNSSAADFSTHPTKFLRLPDQIMDSIHRIKNYHHSPFFCLTH
jgi:hypothetical protein